MRMNELLNMHFFGLLAENSQEVSTQEMKNAYAQFTASMEAISKSDDYTNIFRTLNVSRIEVVHLQTVYQYEQGEKCPEKNVYLQSLILS